MSSRAFHRPATSAKARGGLKPARRLLRTMKAYRRCDIRPRRRPFEGYAMHDVSIPAALIAGLISFLSPCVLPLVPPYLIYLTGATIEHVASDETNAAAKRAVMISAVMFVLGFSTVFVALGASASFIGSLIRAWSAQLSIVAGIVIIIMGLHFLGLTLLGLFMREGRPPFQTPWGR